MTITGVEIDQATGPPDSRRKDVGELYNTAVDITALPGMLGSNRGMEETSEDARNTTEMAATLIASVVGRSQRSSSIHDSMWQSIRRHALSQIKGPDSLFKFVKAVDKDREAAFEKQDFAIQNLLSHRHYSEASIEEYLLNGLLPRLTRESFRCYTNLLSAIRQLAYDHIDRGLWDGGPAKSMLDYHSFKLLQVRRHAMSRKMLILRTYVYLRDADAKGFYHASMTETLWDRVAQLTLQSNTGSSHGGGNSNNDDTSDGGLPPVKPKEGTPRCSHCRNATVHKLLKLEARKTVCVFLELPQAQARKAASEAVALHQTGGGSLKECCKLKLQEHSK
jgi:hypothetical protein